MKIYLADLVYDTIETNYVVPLNIGFIAAYLKEQFLDKVEIKLFKYPKKLEIALKESPPDILGLSHYGWNEKLNNIFFDLAKSINPSIVNVIGGPNIRSSNDQIEQFLLTNLNIDYCILFEGEESFYELVHSILNNSNNLPTGCATLKKGSLKYEPSVYKDKPVNLDLPSPYLSGILDEFITQPNIIPLFESNRGCPYGCTYCAWGVSSLSKIRKRSLDVVLDELEYVAKHSVGQINWIFADANFGIFERDVEIAKKIKSIKEQKGFPISTTLWHSKNTSERNIRISEILGDTQGYIAIQSTDSDVLKNAGRGNIQFKHLKKQIEHYKNKNLSVQTDILIGLPGETQKSHMKTLSDAFELGFDNIQVYNIRMLRGTDYDNIEYREKYKIKTKYRPIFGSYGKYNDKIVFEIEESVRGTSCMSEDELEKFKIIHWFIYFAWNSGIFKPVLKYALKNNVQPLDIIDELIETKNTKLSDIFDEMTKESKAEWFVTKDEMIQYYEKEENYNKLVSNFAKLNFLWIAKFFTNKEKLLLLRDEIQTIIEQKLLDNNISMDNWNDLLKIQKLLVPINLLEDSFEKKIVVNGEILKYIQNDTKEINSKKVQIKIYRDEEMVSFCHYHLKEKNFSLKNVTRFLEIGGMRYLKNKIEIE